MNTTPPAIERLARQLVSLEARDSSDDPAVRACDRLRVPLAKLAGVAGFRSLLSRALALAAADLPGLESAQVGADGSLEGVGRDAGVAVVTHLLGLLMTFIGEPLTLRLVRDAWPDADETDRRGEGQA